MAKTSDDEVVTPGGTTTIDASQLVSYVVLTGPSQIQNSQQISYVVLAPAVAVTARQYAVTVIS